MAKLAYKNGIASVILRVKVLDTTSTTGGAKTDLAYNTAGLIVSTIADNEAAPTVYAQAAGNIETIAALGTFATPTASKCRFAQVDSVNHPGLYEIQIANGRWSVANARSVIVTLSGAVGAAQVDSEIQLDAKIVSDLQDIASGAQMDLVNAPNATAVASIKTNLGTVPASGNWATAGAAMTLTAVQQQALAKERYGCNGTVWHVSTTGNDGNDGLTWATAKATWAAANTAGSDDDVMLFGAGTFDFSAACPFSPKRMRFYGAGEWLTTLTCSYQAFSDEIPGLQPATNSEFLDMGITNTAAGPNPTDAQTVGGVGLNVKFTRCYLSAQYATVLGTLGNGWILDDCDIAGSQNAVVADTIRNCRVTATGDPGSLQVCTQGITVEGTVVNVSMNSGSATGTETGILATFVCNCHVTVVLNLASHSNIAIGIQATTILNSSISVSGGATNISIQGPASVGNCVYDATKTSGTITQAPPLSNLDVAVSSRNAVAPATPANVTAAQNNVLAALPAIDGSGHVYVSVGTGAGQIELYAGNIIVAGYVNGSLTAAAFATGALTAAAFAAGALKGKGDWLTTVGSVTLAANQHVVVDSGVVTSVTDPVTISGMIGTLDALNASIGSGMGTIYSSLTDEVTGLASIKTQTGAIATILSGITSLANWLKAMILSSTPDSTAATEIGGNYAPASDSLQAIGSGEGSPLTMQDVRDAQALALSTDVTPATGSVDDLLGSIAAKTILLGGMSVTLSSPVSSDGAITIIKGDDWPGTAQPAFTFTDYAGPDLTGGSVELLLVSQENYAAGGSIDAELSVAASSVTQSGQTVTIDLTLTAIQTTALSHTAPPDSRPNYVYQLRATTVSGEVVTLALGTAVIVESINPKNY